MAAFMRLDPQVRFSGPRLAAGAFAGAAGGLAFAVIITGQLLYGPYAPDGNAGMIAKLLGTDEPWAVWGFHTLAAVIFGLIFAAVIPPRHAERTVPVALAYGFALWVVAGFLLLHALSGVPLALTWASWMDLAGHLAFGLVLGFVYVAFFRAEEHEADEHAATSRESAPVRRV